MKRILATLAVALLTTTTLAACGGGNDEGTAARKFNDADVTFAQDMIPHHQQAVQMAKMAEVHAASPAVKKLADKIEAAQGPEIETMQGWLEEWGKSDDSDGDTMHSMDGMGDGSDSGSDPDMDMPGMMSDDDMMRLGESDGTDFDSMFLTMMIAHHEGALEMARTEQGEGRNAEAKALAARIEKAQTAEIAEMKGLLGS